jgi:hypothetical protein
MKFDFAMDLAADHYTGADQILLTTKGGEMTNCTECEMDSAGNQVGVTHPTVYRKMAQLRVHFNL